VIRNDLRKEPYNLPAALWRILRKHSLVRTADEERHTLFAQSERVPHRTLFSFTIGRALFASMLLDPLLCAIRFQFVTGANTNIDLVYNHEQKLIKIHEKWIDFEKSHKDVSCDALSMRENGNEESDLFSCDHIVDDLFELVVGAVRDALPLSQKQCWILRSTARQLLHRMPRMVRLSRTATPNQLKLTWTGNESSFISKTFAKHIRYVVILHNRSTCRKGLAFVNTGGSVFRT
jgi:hypothetical protein